MGDLLSENSLRPDPLIALALDLHRLSSQPSAHIDHSHQPQASLNAAHRIASFTDGNI